MSDRTRHSVVDRVIAVVQRLLNERAIKRPVTPEDDLRDAGLTSMDMVNLVLAVESEFDLMIPEVGITPANFRTVAAIGRLVAGLPQQP